MSSEGHGKPKGSASHRVYQQNPDARRAPGKVSVMPYSRSFSSLNPGCVILLVDQSESMAKPFGADRTKVKAETCAGAVNTLLYDLVIACRAGSVIKNRVYVGVLGYGATVGSALPGKLQNEAIVPIAEIAHNPLTVTAGGDGTGTPTWVSATAKNGTPMAKGMRLAANWLRAWTQTHADSFPPVVINITDGQPDRSEDVRSAAASLRSLTTNDGAVLLLNAHIADTDAPKAVFPVTLNGLSDPFASLLYEISSTIPESLLVNAGEAELPAQPGSRGFIYNSDPDAIVRILEFGTSQINQ